MSKGYTQMTRKERDALEDKTSNELNKIRKNIEKLKITKPDRADVDKEQEKLQTAIQNWTYENADKKWKVEEQRALIREVKNRKKSARNNVDQSSEVLSSFRRKQESSNKNIKSVYSARMYRDPEGTKKDLVKEFANLRGQLQGGDISLKEERDVNRRLDTIKGNLKEVQTYLDSNVQAHVKERNKHKKDAEVHKKTLDELYTIWKNIKEEENKIVANIESISEEIDERNQKILENKQNKQLLQSKFRNQLDDYQKYMDDLNRVMSAIQSRTARDRAEKFRAQSKNTEKSDNRKPKGDNRPQKKVIKKTAAELEEEETQRIAKEQKAASLERRRLAAQKEYEKMQAYYRERTAQHVVETAPELTETEVKVADPNNDSKILCRNLIEMCENMKPSDSPVRRGKRKRRKKMRLVHKLENFDKFNRVGVKIPVFAKELDNTIESLKEKLTSFDIVVEESEV